MEKKFRRVNGEVIFAAVGAAATINMSPKDAFEIGFTPTMWNKPVSIATSKVVSVSVRFGEIEIETANSVYRVSGLEERATA